jgi:hypothetical protein
LCKQQQTASLIKRGILQVKRLERSKYTLSAGFKGKEGAAAHFNAQFINPLAAEFFFKY